MLQCPPLLALQSRCCQTPRNENDKLPRKEESSYTVTRHPVIPTPNITAAPAARRDAPVVTHVGKTMETSKAALTAQGAMRQSSFTSLKRHNHRQGRDTRQPERGLQTTEDVPRLENGASVQKRLQTRPFFPAESSVGFRKVVQGRAQQKATPWKTTIGKLRRVTRPKFSTFCELTRNSRL